jgi:exoribonuclease II
MKKLITFLSICTTVAILALPAAARNSIAQPNNAFQDAACTQEAKDALYATIRTNLKADQAKAYEDAKKYLACPASGEVTEAQQKIIDYLKGFNIVF